MNYKQKLSDEIEKSGILKDYSLEIQNKKALNEIENSNSYNIILENAENLNPKTNIAKNLMEVVKDDGMTFYFTDSEECFAKSFIEGKIKTFALKSKHFDILISGLYYNKYNKLPPKDSIKEFIKLLEFQIINKKIFASKTKVSTRTARYNNEIYYDLTNENWQIVKISLSGYEIISDAPIVFNRFSHQLSQALPKENANISDIFRVFNYIRIDENFKTLFLVYLISCYIPEISHPVSVVYGTQGSAKTTTNQIIKSLVDPSKLDNLGLPNDAAKFIEIVYPHLWVNFDNVSHIKSTTSDELCKTVTGAATQKRKLYTDNDMCLYTYSNCVSLNGINCVVERPDLMDRSLLFELAPINQTERKTISEIQRNFEKDKPYILGAIFKILSQAIKLHESGVRPKELLRLADFCTWGYCIGEALGGKGNEFMNQYQKNRQIQTIQVISSNIIATSIIEYVENWLKNYHANEFKINSTELYEVIKKTVSDKSFINFKNFPANSASFVKYLKRLSPVLEEVGIEVNIKHTSTKNFINFKIDEFTFTRSILSQYDN